MSEIPKPGCCLLCDTGALLRPARFRQLYSQTNGPPAEVNWWKCRKCKGWFAFPVPSVEQIKSHLASIWYAAHSKADTVFLDKKPVFDQILDGLAPRVGVGRLLDFGSNYGHFLELAKSRGWDAIGFEPAPAPAEHARQRGADVRCAWSLDNANLHDGMFDAIVVVDAFCHVWHPAETLRTFHRLLRPGGTLVMRITNKSSILRLIDRLTPAGEKKNKRMSRLLGDQFHSISLRSLAGVLASVGFESVEIKPGATTAPLESAPSRTRWAYRLADGVYRLSASRVILSPGVLLWARSQTVH